MRRIKTFVGATGRTLQFAAKQPDGSAYVLTGLTVTLFATYNSNTKFDWATCTVTDNDNGYFEITPTSGQIDVKGDYKAIVKVTDGSDPDYLEKFVIEVEEVPS